MKKFSRSKLKLRAIREWGAQIVKPKKRARIALKEPSVLAPSSSTGTSSVNSSNDPHSLLQDSVSSSKLKRSLNLDRRAANSERRVSSNTSYKGPVRRYTVDRRANMRDRRSSR